jgi:hypothetical protein
MEPMQTHGTIHTLQASWGYGLAKSQLGEAQKADELLFRIEAQIASEPERFPIVALPDIRLASSCVKLGGAEAMIGVFFRRLDDCTLELQNLCLDVQKPSQPIFRATRPALGLAA